MTYDHIMLAGLMFYMLSNIFFLVKMELQSQKVIRETLDILKEINNKVEK